MNFQHSFPHDVENSMCKSLKKMWKHSFYEVIRQLIFNNPMWKGGVKLGKRFFNGYI